MVRKALPGFAVLLLAACLVVACQSGPSLPRSVTVQPGHRTDITLLQVSGHLKFALQNESGSDAIALYRDEQANQLAKVVPDAHMQALLDIFTEKGLFATSFTAVPPDARDVLAVEQAGRRWVWARRHAGLQASEASFHEAKNYFLEVYNSSTAYHRGPSERPDLKAERSRARDDGSAAKRKLEGIGGQQ